MCLQKRISAIVRAPDRLVGQNVSLRAAFSLNAHAHTRLYEDRSSDVGRSEFGPDAEFGPDVCRVRPAFLRYAQLVDQHQKTFQRYSSMFLQEQVKPKEPPLILPIQARFAFAVSGFAWMAAGSGRDARNL